MLLQARAKLHGPDAPTEEKPKLGRDDFRVAVRTFSGQWVSPLGIGGMGTVAERYVVSVDDVWVKQHPAAWRRLNDAEAQERGLE